MDMAEIGATAKGGRAPARAQRGRPRRPRPLPRACASRPASPSGWTPSATCSPADPAATRRARPVLFGSHLDSQPSGGKFDGALGVIAGLELMRTSNDLEHHHRGAARAGQLDRRGRQPLRQEPDGLRRLGRRLRPGRNRSAADLEGTTVGAALDAIGYPRPRTRPPLPRRRVFRAAYRAGPDPGARSQADRHRHRRPGADLVRRGRHRPGQPRRHHAPQHPPRRAARRRARDRAGRPHHARATARTAAAPSASSSWPRTAATWSPARSASASSSATPTRPRSRASPTASNAKSPRSRASGKIDLALTELFRIPAQQFDPACVDLVRQAAARLGYSARDIVSGAGHDAVYVARHVPTAMIFTPCKDGLSHNEAESIEPEEAEAGAQILFEAVLARANRRFP